MIDQKLIEALEEKYKSQGENPNTYLAGLLQAKPITYWDYIQTDTLLSLQKPRTDFKDEEIFIIYHQITELYLKLIRHEVEQLVEAEVWSEEFVLDKINRINRYTYILADSFDIMKYGMDYDDYNTFRMTLAPASGFQSAQFRFIELYFTRVENLINSRGKERLSENPTLEELFANIYWRDAGMNYKTGKRTKTLELFEEKYLKDFIQLAKKMEGNTIEERFDQIENPSQELTDALKKLDEIYNIRWPLIHLDTAQHYLDKKGETKAATGGSEWKKYLHPMYQQRKFFPNIWSAEEKANWAKDYEL